jgi:cardiolipin synthase A/B
MSSQDENPRGPISEAIPSGPRIDFIASTDAFRHAGVRLRSPVYADTIVGAHRVRLLKDGAQAFPAMLEAIGLARSTVCLETYILRDDRTGERFADALIERARAGVEVNLMFDAWGSSVSNAYLLRLRTAGVRVVAYHPVRFSLQTLRLFGPGLARDHRKALIVDGRVAFTGGINLADDYAPALEGGGGFRDTHLCLEGPAAAELQYFFLRTWRRARGAPIDAPRYAIDGRRADPSVHIIASDMRRGRSAIRETYRTAIRNAQKTIYITNAYFLPTLRLLRALRRAARRGVDVRIMVAGTTDVPAVRLASRSIYGRLLRAGARIFEWTPSVLHAKTAIIDGHWTTVGSSNLDQQSLRLNLEANAIIEDPGFATEMEAMFHEDLARCEEITAEHLHAFPPWERAASWAAYMFRDWL